MGSTDQYMSITKTIHCTVVIAKPGSTVWLASHISIVLVLGDISVFDDVNLNRIKRINVNKLLLCLKDIVLEYVTQHYNTHAGSNL